MDNIIKVANRNQVGGALIPLIPLLPSPFNNECDDDEGDGSCCRPKCGENGPIQTGIHNKALLTI